MIRSFSHYAFIASKEFYLKAPPYLDEVAAFLLIFRVAQNGVKGTFSKLKNVQRTYIALSATTLVFGVLKRFSLGYLAVAWLVTEAVNFAYKDKSKQEQSDPISQALRKCLTLLQKKPITKQASLSFPSSINSSLEKVKPGKFTSFQAADGWDLDFFIWVVTQKISLDVYYFSGTANNEVDELQAYIKRHPKSVIITTNNLLNPLILPPQTYLITYFPPTVGFFSAEVSSNCIFLDKLSKDETIELLKLYAASDRYITFEEESVKLIYEFAQQDKSKSSFYWVNLLRGLNVNCSEIGIATSDSKLTLYPRSSKSNPRELIEMSISMQKFGLEKITYCPPKDVGMPYFLTQVQKGNSSNVRLEQTEQIIEALGVLREENTSHAAILGFTQWELERVLSMLTVPGLNVVKLNDFLFLENVGSDPNVLLRNIDVLLNYLWTNPKTILYIPFLENVLQTQQSLMWSLLRYIHPQTSILGRLSKGDRTFLQRIEDIEMFKQVRLMPLTQEQCLADLRAWAAPYKFEAQALEIAVEASFLLHKQDGSEFMFTKDLIERAGKKEAFALITAHDVWKIFIQLYHLHVEQKEQEQFLLQIQNQAHKQEHKSLVLIALALKKKYNADLPVELVKISEPPSFLKDLNEKVKNLEQFAVAIEKPLEDLSKALSGGQYKNALIKGPSGVGKTTLVKWAAWKSAHGQFESNHPLYGKTIYALNLADFLKNSKFLGEMESNIDVLFNFLMQTKNAVLFIDEVHLIMGAGAYRGNEMGTFAQHMKTYLEESGISIIGATTEDEYNKWVKKDGAFVRRFNKPITLNEPTDDDMIKIFTYYISSEGYKQINPSIEISEANLRVLLNKLKTSHSDISKVDRGKKLLEEIAKSKQKENEPINEFINRISVE